MTSSVITAWRVAILLELLALPAAFAQSSNFIRTTGAEAVKENSASPRAVPCFGVQERQPEKQLEENAIAMLPNWDRLWLTEDVADLISPKERCAFLHLLTDQERRHFVESFWARRAPDPTSLNNTFKREHYERIAFADEKFGSQIPGWKTDRGRIYVRFGPPDSIESHRAGETDADAAAEAVEKHHPSEMWHYNQLHEKAVNLEFVDPGGTGDYRLAVPAELKDELTLAPADGLGGTGEPSPIIHFKDLEACAISGLERDQLHFTPRIEFFNATDATTLARILVQVAGDWPDSPRSGPSSPATYEVFGRISTPSRVVEMFEDKISFDGQPNSPQAQPHSQFEAALAPGTYPLTIVIKNVATGDVGTLRETIAVPSYEKLNSAKSAQ